MVIILNRSRILNRHWSLARAFAVSLGSGNKQREILDNIPKDRIMVEQVFEFHKFSNGRNSVGKVTSRQTEKDSTDEMALLPGLIASEYFLEDLQTK